MPILRVLIKECKTDHNKVGIVVVYNEDFPEYHYVESPNTKFWEEIDSAKWMLTSENAVNAGIQLYRILFSAIQSNAEQYSLFRHHANVTTQELRYLSIEIQDKKSLSRWHSLPWELLYDPEVNSFFNSDSIAIVRCFGRLQNPQTVKRYSPRESVFVYDSKSGLDWDDELKSARILAAKFNGLSLHKIRLQDLNKTDLESQALSFLHVCAHGKVNDSGTPVILRYRNWFKSLFYAPIEITPRDLQRTVKCKADFAFFNACFSGFHDANILSSTTFPGKFLRDCEYGFVICNQYSPKDQNAIRFSKCFYDNMSLGHSLAVSAMIARESVWRECYQDGDSSSWCIPTVYTKSFLDMTYRVEP